MDNFHYKQGQLFCEEVDIDKLATVVDTPFYLYSTETIQNHYTSFYTAFKDLKPLICYSIKNCGNINIIQLLTNLGSGIDVVSGGELFRALKANADPSKIVFAGVGKKNQEIKDAMLAGVGWFNIESEEEFENTRLIAAELKCTTNVALRINPNTYDKKTHVKTSTGIPDTKFGVDISKALSFFKKYGQDPYLKLKGIHIHIGSPIYSGAPYVLALEKILEFVNTLEKEGMNIEMIDIGGGFIAHYDGKEESKNWNDYASYIVPILQPFVNKGGKIILEPGRAITANAGVLISKVLYNKKGLNKKFIIVDTGMNHIIRPALYDAYHFIWPTKTSAGNEPVNKQAPSNMQLEKFDIVGPICESSDFLAKDRPFPTVKQNDLICIFTAGAYCMTMSSQYNATPRPPEILVHGSRISIIRQRETYDDLINLELNPQKLNI